MNYTTAMLLTGLVVMAGEWSQKKTIDIKVIIGGAMVAIVLTIMGDLNVRLANLFATCIAITAVLNYGMPIVGHIFPGTTPTTPTTWAPFDRGSHGAGTTTLRPQ